VTHFVSESRAESLLHGASRARHARAQGVRRPSAIEGVAVGGQVVAGRRKEIHGKDLASRRASRARVSENRAGSREITRRGLPRPALCSLTTRPRQRTPRPTRPPEFLRAAFAGLPPRLPWGAVAAPQPHHQRRRTAQRGHFCEVHISRHDREPPARRVGPQLRVRRAIEPDQSRLSGCGKQIRQPIG
jgi:hypothetical protein